MIRVLLIDDEEEATDLLANLLAQWEDVHVIDKVHDSAGALKAFLKHRPDIVFLDIQMPNSDGLEFAKEVKSFDLETKIVFVTAYEEYAIKALRQEAFDYLLKPVSRLELSEVLNRFRNVSKQAVSDIKSQYKKWLSNDKIGRSFLLSSKWKLYRNILCPRTIQGNNHEPRNLPFTHQQLLKPFG